MLPKGVQSIYTVPRLPADWKRRQSGQALDGDTGTRVSNTLKVPSR